MKKQDKKLHKLRYLREVAGLKQDDMAVLIGCTKPNYCLRENGKVEFRLSEIWTIKDALNEKFKKEGKPEVTLEDIFLR